MLHVAQSAKLLHQFQQSISRYVQGRVQSLYKIEVGGAVPVHDFAEARFAYPNQLGELLLAHPQPEHFYCEPAGQGGGLGWLVALLDFVGINGGPEGEEALQVLGFVFLAQAHGFGEGRLILRFVGDGD